MYFKASRSALKTLSALFDAPLAWPSANLPNGSHNATESVRADRREGLSHTERLNFAGAKTKGRELRAGFSVTVL